MLKMSGENKGLAPKASATNWILWGALLLAFSPVLADQGQHWLDSEWSRYSILFVPLLAWAVYRSPAQEPRRKLGLALVAFSLVIELVVARGAMIELARPAFSLAVIGLVVATGLAPVRTALLALWIVPIPSFLIDVVGGSDLALDPFASLAELLSRLGLDLEVTGRLLVSGGQELSIDSSFAGLPLFALLSGLGWYRALRLKLRPLATLRCLLLHLLCGAPIQLGAAVLAMVAFSLGAEVTSEILLEPVPWLMSMATAVYLRERSGPGAPRRFVLLDRDGTLVRDSGYTHRIEDYERLPRVVEGLQRLRDAGYSFAIITNQSGIGRGYYSEQDFHDFQEHLLADLASHGISIEGSYFCPHRPDEGCACRKPEPAMLHQLSRELGADLAQCWVVGDGLGDVLVAERAGCRGVVLVATGRGGETSEQVGPEVRRAADLLEAADVILAEGVDGLEGRESVSQAIV